MKAPRDLIDELAELIEAPLRQPGDVSIRDWADRSGVSRTKARYDLDRLVKRGILEKHFVFDHGRWLYVYRRVAAGDPTSELAKAGR